MGFPPSSRFTAHPFPPRFPGKCACCGSANKPVIEFGLSIGYTTPENNEYGEVYLCFDCIVEAADGTDLMVPMSTYMKALDEINAIAGTKEPLLKAMKEFNERQRIAYAEFDSAVASAGNPPVDSPEISGQQAEGNDSADESNVREPVKTSRQKRGTSSNEGSVSVSSGTSDGSDVFNL